MISLERTRVPGVSGSKDEEIPRYEEITGIKFAELNGLCLRVEGPDGVYTTISQAGNGTRGDELTGETRGFDSY